MLKIGILLLEKRRLEENRIEKNSQADARVGSRSLGKKKSQENDMG